MPPAPPRVQGQWALGHREPLNANERVKKDDDGLNVRARIENIYSEDGLRLDRPAATCAAACAGTGLYTQRTPGHRRRQDRRSLEPEELDDKYFMLRVRIDGGQLNLAQLRAVGDVSTEFARDTADVTDRQNVQYHWIRIEDVPEIWRPARRRRPVDAPRRAATPRASSSAARWPASRPTRSSTARRRSTASTSRTSGARSSPTCPASSRPRSAGCPEHARRPRDQRHLVRRRRAPRAARGFDLWVGGGLSTNPMIAAAARRLRQPERGARGVGRRDRGSSATTGYRRLRAPRAHQVPDGRLGAGEVPRGARGRVPRPRAARRPRAAAPPTGAAATTSVSTRRRTASATSASRRASGAGPARQLREVADLAEASARGRVRDDGRAEDGRPRRRRGQGRRRWSPGSRRATCCVAPERVPPRHDGLHGHRVLQARDRRDQGAGRGTRRRARAAAADVRPADHHQRQRLPELVRPLPGRRHRLQGLDRHDADGDRSRASRSTSAA